MTGWRRLLALKEWKWLRVLVSLAALAGILVAACCWYLGIRSPADVVAYVGMYNECHPVWKEFALKRVYAGQSVEEVIDRTAPPIVQQHGIYTTLEYQTGPLSFTGIRLIAKNNQLVTAEAWSCSWRHTFFQDLSQEDELDWLASWYAHRRPNSGRISN
jgi:hypothetical protein